MSWPQPNEHGVYRPTEVLELPMPRKGWRGSPLAEIRLCHIEQGWIWATGYNCPASGGGSPLHVPSDTRAPSARLLQPTRAAAIAAAARYLCDDFGKRKRPINEVDIKPYRQIVEWAESLLEQQTQPDLFEGIAA